MNATEVSDYGNFTQNYPGQKALSANIFVSSLREKGYSLFEVYPTSIDVCTGEIVVRLSLLPIVNSGFHFERAALISRELKYNSHLVLPCIPLTNDHQTQRAKFEDVLTSEA